MEMKLFELVAELKAADIPFSSRHPIVLSPDHELRRLIVMNSHEELRYQGVELVQL